MSYYSPQSPKNEAETGGQLIAIICGFLALAIVTFLAFNILVNSVISFLPYSVEQKLGAVIAPIYEKQAVDSPQQKTLNQLLDRLETNLPAKQKAQNQYQVFYIPDETVNAIAIPGNKVIIYKGLLQEVESENELMMVLGHELGHFANRDHLRGLGNALVIRMTLGFFLGDAGIFQSGVGTLVRAVSNAQYSQKQEVKADTFGLNLLDQTYNHVAGATDFFSKLSNKEKSDFDFLSSHPALAERVKKLEQQIKSNNYKLGSINRLPKALNDL